MGDKTGLVVLLLGLGIFIVYLFTSAGNTPFNHFTLLADSFLKGHLHIEGNYPWLEKVPIDDNKFYVVNPPMPALLAIPFVFFFGKGFPQQYIAHLIGICISIITFYISLRIKKSLRLAVWSSLLVGLGSIIFYMSSVGSMWYLGQITGVFFMSLSECPSPAC